MTGRPIPARYGWLALALYVAAWDLHPRTTTLSTGFAPEGTHGRLGALCAWTYITLHLLRVLPDRCDPLRRLPCPNGTRRPTGR